jgi:hypothetical protein
MIMTATSGRLVITSYVCLVVEVEVLHAALRVLRVHPQQYVLPVWPLPVAAAARPQVAPCVNHYNAEAQDWGSSSIRFCEAGRCMGFSAVVRHIPLPIADQLYTASSSTSWDGVILVEADQFTHVYWSRRALQGRRSGS